MKKLDIISNKIKSSSNNYFGRGCFEDIIKENSKNILSWLENLIPIQEQIKKLEELGFEGLQKRNYVRILTKLLPKEYSHFIAMNIILRDINSITTVFKGIHDTRKQYDTLLNHSKLKFPGKHQKFVDFHTYQQFVSFYKDDLINRAIDFDIDDEIYIEPNQQYIYNIHTSFAEQNEVDTKIEEEKQEEYEEKEEEIKSFDKKIISENEKINEEVESLIDSTDEENIGKDEIKNENSPEIDEQQKNKKLKKEKTDWIQVLLKGI